MCPRKNTNKRAITQLLPTSKEMYHRKIRFMTALSGLAFAISMSPATAQEQTFAPFQLEVQQPMLFGQADGAFLQGGISDTIRGALLKTIQQKNGPRAKPSYAPRYEILQPRIAPDLSGQLAIASSKFVPELKARTGGMFDLPVRKLDGQVDLQQKTNTALEELTPRADKQFAPFDLTAKRDDVHTIDLKPRSPSEAPVLAAAVSAPIAIPDIAKDAPIEFRERPREVAELLPAKARSQDLDLTPKAQTRTAVDLTAAKPQVAMDLTPAKGTSVQLELPTQREERRETAIELAAPKLITQPKTEPKLVPKPEPKPKVQDELRTKAKLQPAPRIEPMAALPKLVKIKQIKEKPVKTPKPPQRSQKEQEKIEWDAWYDQVGKLCDQRLVTELDKCDNAVGWCTVSIAVRRNQKMGVVFIKGSGNSFIEAVLTAYRALDGHSSLAFPPGTKRTEVEFQVTSRQSNQGPIVDIDAKRITGDTEIITK